MVTESDRRSGRLWPRRRWPATTPPPTVTSNAAEPLFLAPDNAGPATPRHFDNWLARISRETGLRFDATSGWNRYATSPWATFHELAAAALIAR